MQRATFSSLYGALGFAWHLLNTGTMPGKVFLAGNTFYVVWERRQS